MLNVNQVTDFQPSITLDAEKMTDYERITSSGQLDSRKDNPVRGAAGLSTGSEIAPNCRYCQAVWVSNHLDGFILIHITITYTYGPSACPHFTVMLTKRRRALFSDSGTMRGS